MTWKQNNSTNILVVTLKFPPHPHNEAKEVPPHPHNEAKKVPPHPDNEAKEVLPHSHNEAKEVPPQIPVRLGSELPDKQQTRKPTDTQWRFSMKDFAMLALSKVRCYWGEYLTIPVTSSVQFVVSWQGTEIVSWMTVQKWAGLIDYWVGRQLQCGEVSWIQIKDWGSFVTLCGSWPCWEPTSHYQLQFVISTFIWQLTTGI